MNKLLFATCLTLINVASALYSDSSPVVKLTQ